MVGRWWGKVIIRAFKYTIQKSSSKKEKILCWKPPLDGALIDKIQNAGVGTILRDEFGNVIVALSKVEHGVDSADGIKTLALKAL